MSLSTHLYLGTVNLAALYFIRPWPLTLLGTAAAVINNYLVSEGLLTPTKIRTTSAVITFTAGITLLYARSWVPSSPWEVVPFSLVYSTVLTLPYLLFQRWNRSEPVVEVSSPLQNEPPEEVRLEVMKSPSPLPSSPSEEEEYELLLS